LIGNLSTRIELVQHIVNDRYGSVEGPQLADYCLSAIDGTGLRIQPVDATH
jgi:hypothetical protein